MENREGIESVRKTLKLIELMAQHGGSLTVTQIADRCGFSDSNYFGDAFKKAIGLSPREYRKLS